MMRKANRIWLAIAVLLSLTLLAVAVPYFQWAIFVDTEQANPHWPDHRAMFWDGIGFGFLYLILKLWWCAIPAAAFLVFAWLKAFPKPKYINSEQAGPGYPPQGVGSPDP